MARFSSPLKDMQFVIHDVLDFGAHYPALTGTESVTPELLDAVLTEAARFADREIAPLNRGGDEQGCRLEDGVVTTPDGFKEAYRSYVAGGWSAMTGDPAYGGQGLPASIGLFVEEVLTSANMAWTMYPGLSSGVMNALNAHGTDEQKGLYLPRMLSGEWTGTMCLTEPHAGSDVGILRTKAVPNADGSFAITGTKIFISAGEHDLAENIVHLVLARLPEAPDGTKGISLFLVPKFEVSADGTIGARNGVTCSAIEEKMGIHGNSTCVLDFEKARGLLVGPENGGMRCMFTMMNGARLLVGVQGLGLMEAAYQRSLDYARERTQMRALTGPKNPEEPADPIIVHPDVRRMLLTQKALTEGGRALAYFAGQLSDLARHGDSDEIRQKAQRKLDFVIPIVKGFLTESGFESVNHAIQVHGGHGFIRETGVEQHSRDCRITLIYEGTTQIQALDLLGRKVMLTQGAGLMDIVAEIDGFADGVVKGQDETAALGERLKVLTQEWGELTLAVAGKARPDPNELGAASVDYLMYSGYVMLAYLWARMAAAARAKRDAGTADPFLDGKVATARFFFERLLPRAAAHKAAIEAGAPSLMEIDDEAFSHL